VHKFRDILVYAEVYDEECLAQVMSLATEHGAAVTVCEVIAPPPRESDSRGVVDRVSKLRTERAHQRLRDICDHFSEHMVIDHAVYVGMPFTCITWQVIEQDFDLVVHISEPVQSQAGCGLNATGMHLMRKCPCTVWTLHPGRPDAGRNVVLAVDREFGAEFPAAEAFAVTMAETAIALAVALKGELHVIHCWQPYGRELLDDPELQLSESEREFYVGQQRLDSEAWFKRIFQRVAGLAPGDLPLSSHLILGAPLAAVLGAVEDNDAAVLVLGTVGATAIPGVLIGPTTESILASCGTGVLALKPPGFVSPLDARRDRGQQ
jgi:nucleotide-binding universal stress UspA family protein